MVDYHDSESYILPQDPGWDQFPHSACGAQGSMGITQKAHVPFAPVSGLSYSCWADVQTQWMDILEQDLDELSRLSNVFYPQIPFSLLQLGTRSCNDRSMPWLWNCVPECVSLRTSDILVNRPSDKTAAFIWSVCQSLWCKYSYCGWF